MDGCKILIKCCGEEEHDLPWINNSLYYFLIRVVLFVLARQIENVESWERNARKVIRHQKSPGGTSRKKDHG
jgi:hypothetical protein